MHLATLRSHVTRTFNKSTHEGDKLEAGRTLTLLDHKGPGQIKRLHLTNRWNDPLFPRKALLKVYWDGEERPSILCPVGDFFCDAFCGQAIDFATEYFGNHGKHWYCYLPMPFDSGCRIEIENQGELEDTCVAYDVTVEEWEHCPAELGRLHACWRRTNPIQPGSPYTILETSGTGHFVGCNLSVQALGTPSLAFLEGISYVYVDGTSEPVLKVWGTEDFLGGSFYFCGGTYAGPYSGSTVRDEQGGRFAGYRLFIKDAIPFDSHINVLVNHGEHFNSGPISSYEGQADYSSVAYWYQAEPHSDASYEGQAVRNRLPTQVRIIAGNDKQI